MSIILLLFYLSSDVEWRLLTDSFLFLNFKYGLDEILQCEEHWDSQ